MGASYRLCLQGSLHPHCCNPAVPTATRASSHNLNPVMLRPPPLQKPPAPLRVGFPGGSAVKNTPPTQEMWV